MKMLKTDSLPFPGWEPLLKVIIDVGPRRFLRMIAWKAHAEGKQNGQTFVGDSVHNYLNHHVMARVAIQLMVDGHPSPPVEQETTDDERLAIIRSFLWVNGMLERRSAEVGKLNLPAGTPSSQRTLRDSWRMAMEVQQRHTTPKYEIARTWLILREYWQDRAHEVLTSHDINLREPMSSGFDDLLAYLWVTLTLSQGPWVNQVGALEDTTSPEHYKKVIDHYVPMVDEVAEGWPEITRSTKSWLDNPFLDEPVVRLPTGELVAPDPGVLMSGLTNRFVRRSLAGFAEDSPSLGEAARTLVGFAFEEYGRALLRAISAADSSEYVGEFETIPGSLSPDGFLLNPTELGTFEFKSLRLPVSGRDISDLSTYRSWIGASAGERKEKGKLPFEQYQRFLKTWASGNAPSEARLGKPTRFKDGFYAVVTVDDAPITAHWPKHRTLLWGGGLHSGLAFRDSEAVWLSIHDLELLAGLVEHAKEAGRPLNAVQLLLRWKKWLQQPALRSADDRYMSLRGSLKAYLQEHHTELFGRAPDLLTKAMDEAFRQVSLEVFDYDPVRAKE